MAKAEKCKLYTKSYYKAHEGQFSLFFLALGYDFWRRFPSFLSTKVCYNRRTKRIAIKKLINDSKSYSTHMPIWRKLNIRRQLIKIQGSSSSKDDKTERSEAEKTIINGYEWRRNGFRLSALYDCVKILLIIYFMQWITRNKKRGFMNGWYAFCSN